MSQSSSRDVPPMQKVGHAVQILRAKQRNPRLLLRRIDPPAHVQLRGKRSKCLFESSQVEARLAAALMVLRFTAVQRPFHAHEEQAQVVILVLVGMQNVGSVLVEHSGDAGHQTLAIGAVDQENGCVFHGLFSLSHGR